MKPKKRVRVYRSRRAPDAPPRKGSEEYEATKALLRLAPTHKKCKQCCETKAIGGFHKHPQMGDGYLNVCAVCVCAKVRAWKEKQDDGYNARRYARQLELGSTTRKAPQKHGRDPLARKAASARYSHKRRYQQTVLSTEFDEFVFRECILLNAMREKATGFKWHVDHTVPLNHKDACGLHVAANFQSVPGRWNELKRNTSMKPFWPTRWD